MQQDQPRETRKGEEIDLESLNRYLSGFPAVGQAHSQKQFPGGFSNLTYLIQTNRGEFILRRPPVGAAIKSAHDMGREFRVLSLLRPHYTKVPEPLLYCDDHEVIGVPFYVMQRLNGIILRPTMIGKISLSAGEMRTLSESLVDNLVALHSLDMRVTKLDQLGKPEGYIARQVDGWTKRYQAAKTDSIPEMDAVADWLVLHQPADESPSLLHNDYKYDNIVLKQSNLSEIVGVLDWEMSTVGDPWMDLGAALAYWCEDGDGELAKVFNISWLPGNLARREVVDRYMEKSGRSVSSPVFYYVFGLYKNAVIAQQIYARWKKGHSKDPRFGTLDTVIRDLGKRASVAIESNRI